MKYRKRELLILQGYKSIRWILFQFDPEKVHIFFIKLGKKIQKIKFARRMFRYWFRYQNQRLEQNILGIKFKNPIGLSAGFDKNGEIINLIEDLGFGFEEIGSISAKPCKGNKGIRLKRRTKKKSLWVNLGLNNEGVDKICARLAGKKFNIPVGLNIAKTNCTETINLKKAIEDYIYTIKKFYSCKIGDYFTINISCPNVREISFAPSQLLDELMKKISRAKIKKPIFIKLSPTISEKELDKIIELSNKYPIAGFICSNLLKSESGGGLSGKELQKSADDLIAEVYKKTKGEKIIIGVGGIFNEEDVYKKIKLGANLVQLITGMIYEGPAVVGKINHRLA